MPHSMDLPKHPPAAPTKRATCPSMLVTCKRRIRRHGFSGAAERIRRNRRSRSALLAAYGTGNRKARSEEHTSELQSLMRISYAVFCLKTKIKTQQKVVTNQK